MLVSSFVCELPELVVDLEAFLVIEEFLEHLQRVPRNVEFVFVKNNTCSGNKRAKPSFERVGVDGHLRVKNL